MRFGRPVAMAAAVLLVGSALAGCSTVDTFLHDTFPDQFGPQRGPDGRVSEPVDAHSYYLETGDCFDFPDPSVRTEVRIVRCADEHAFEVIGQGEITRQEQVTQGLQNAVSARCAEPFERFRANAPVGSRPDQEFLISEQKVGDRTVTEYVCAAALTKL
ncbi:MAG: hypothetical protein BGO95_10745 [Micrococcales bacterium 73-13]|nr:MAG: hypothetical protein BGO95_10745 [Micrococcales bacterium 73-13]